MTPKRRVMYAVLFCIVGTEVIRYDKFRDVETDNIYAQLFNKIRKFDTIILYGSAFGGSKL